MKVHARRVRWMLLALLGPLAFGAGALAAGGTDPTARTPSAQWSALSDLERCPRLVVGMQVVATDGGSPLYVGEHVRRQDGPLIRIQEHFSDAAGRVVMRTESAYRADTLRPVSFRMEDPLQGGTDWLRATPQDVELGTRENADATPTVRTLPLQEPALFGPTVVDFMRREWDALAAGGRIRFQLLVPGRAEAYPFRMERTGTPASSAPAGTSGRMTFRIEPDEFLMRQFVNPLLFVFESTPPHRLLEYHGRSSIRDGEHFGKPVRVLYRYPDGC